MASLSNGQDERKRRLLQRYGTTVWPSFLVAAVASVVFFGNIDPETLQVQTLPEWNISRLGGYTIGFFMFWGVGLASSILCLILQKMGNRPT
ncbi:hypothetical protein M0534_04690 [Methylonatrum kenyense]|uniref:hypothetical protein n=1 Tax=Methylonatrum kenyense TaxID=455253 RepID=UPI0020BF20D4|nr:hypothetical protein [Methylonatrum kenyense]MCK8515625.1 hypothetical protein [Methylonatrum kenyense]